MKISEQLRKIRNALQGGWIKGAWSQYESLNRRSYCLVGADRAFGTDASYDYLWKALQICRVKNEYGRDFSSLIEFNDSRDVNKKHVLGLCDIAIALAEIAEQDTADHSV